MDNRAEVKAFLTTRRARVTPEQVGLTGRAGAGRTRRVPGLRRSEVADLAGVSVEYYAQLERGNLAGVSDGVLDSLARALRLDDAERAHLSALADAAGPARRITRRPRSEQVRPGSNASSTAWTPSRSSSTTRASTPSPPTPWGGPCSLRSGPVPPDGPDR